MGVLKIRSSLFRVPMSSTSAFRILMAGSSISMLGSRISTIAFPMLVLHLNSSPLVAGAVAFAAILPSMLVYVPAGVLVDRWDPWYVMLGSELMRGLVAVSVVAFLLGLSGHVSIYLLMSCLVIEEILEIFWMLADRRFASQVLDRDKIPVGQASIEIRMHAAVLAGRPIGPFLFAISGFLPFLADAVSFVISVYTLLLVAPRKAWAARELTPTRRMLRHEIYGGFGWLIANWYAAGVMIVMSFTTLIAQALIMMFLVEAHDRRLSVVAIGAVLASSGAGGIIGCIVARRLPARVKAYWLRIQLLAWSLALGLLALNGVRLVWCIAVVMLILGLTGSIGNIEFGAHLVQHVHNNLLARVTSIGQVMAIAAAGLGPFIGGAAIQEFGIQVAICFFLFLVLIAAVLAFFGPWISPQRARLDVAEPARAAGSAPMPAVDGDPMPAAHSDPKDDIHFTPLPL